MVHAERMSELVQGDGSNLPLEFLSPSRGGVGFQLLVDHFPEIEVHAWPDSGRLESRVDLAPKVFDPLGIEI
jgi:hypothetical protein